MGVRKIDIGSETDLHWSCYNILSEAARRRFLLHGLLLEPIDCPEAQILVSIRIRGSLRSAEHIKNVNLPEG